MALNNATTAKTVTVGTEMARAGFTQVWPATKASLRTDAEGRTTITVPPLSATVWRASATLRDRKEAPAIHLEKPSAGGVVGGRAPITVGVPDGGFNQVTVAWRRVGADGWTPLGTDDNAPYRVFHDVTAMPEGTLLEYRAVLRDSSGNLSVASSWATVGEPEAEPTPGGGGDGGPVTQPAAVSVPGSHNSEMGCPGDWQPDCAEAQMALDADDQVWKRTGRASGRRLRLQGGHRRHLGRELRRRRRPRRGSNIPLALDAPRDVTFYYDHRSHWVTSDAQGPIITLAGSMQSELGCPGDWAPDCMRGWLQDPDGDGTFTFDRHAPGRQLRHQGRARAVLDGELRRRRRARRGRHRLRRPVGRGRGGLHLRREHAPAAGLDPQRRHRARPRPGAGAVAAPRPRRVGRRRHAAAATGCTGRRPATSRVDAEAVTGGSSVPLTHDPAGLPADVLADFPHLAGYEAFRLDRAAARRVPEILTGQLAVAAYDSSGALRDATGVQVPGVLDDVYADAAEADLGPTWRGNRPTLSLWAPTAQDVAAVVAGQARPR